jgi:hypothetical protein
MTEKARRCVPRAPALSLLGAVLLASMACAGEETPGSAGSGASAPAEDRPAGGQPPGSPEPASPQPSPPSIDSTEWTVGVVEAAGTPTPSNDLPVVRSVRTAAHEGYDRFTIELSGSGLPGYHVEYVDRPLIQCGSGNQIQPVGSAWLEVRLYPANAHTEAGAPTLPGREIPAEGTLFRRIYLTCDFEAVVTLTVALEAANPIRVSTLGGPPRIVVDVRH